MRDFLNPVTGDLVLIKSRSRKKSANLIAQGALRLKRAQYSHVAIALDCKIALHSMPNNGVQPILLRDLLDPTKVADFSVFRNSEVESDRTLQSRLRSSLIYYLDQPYNRAFFFRLADRSSFCSELAAKAYARIGRAIAKRKSQFVLPVDIEGLASDPTWRNATGDYSEPTLIDDSSEFEKELMSEAARFNAQLESDYLEILEGERSVRAASLLMTGTGSLFKEISKRFGKRFNPLPEPRKYWDSKLHARRGRH